MVALGVPLLTKCWAPCGEVTMPGAVCILGLPHVSDALGVGPGIFEHLSLLLQYLSSPGGNGLGNGCKTPGRESVVAEEELV